MRCHWIVALLGCAMPCLQMGVVGEQSNPLRQRAMAAIEAGTQAEAPEPYWLRHASMSSDDVGNAVVGAVYTPFSRVAFAAWERKRHGQALSIADAEALIADNRLYVALRWRGDLGELDPGTMQIRALPRATETFSEGRSTKPLVWFDGAQARAVLGSAPPWEDVGAVAVFPAQTFTPEYDFVIFKSAFDSENMLVRRQVGRARIKRADYARWRW